MNGLFFCHNTGEVRNMNKLIARLIRTGMPREVALAVYRSFKRNSNLFEFERYVEGVEEEQKIQEEYYV